MEVPPCVVTTTETLREIPENAGTVTVHAVWVGQLVGTAFPPNHAWTIPSGLKSLTPEMTTLWPATPTEGVSVASSGAPTVAGAGGIVGKVVVAPGWAAFWGEVVLGDGALWRAGVVRATLGGGETERELPVAFSAITTALRATTIAPTTTMLQRIALRGFGLWLATSVRGTSSEMERPATGAYGRVGSCLSASVTSVGSAWTTRVGEVGTFDSFTTEAWEEPAPGTPGRTRSVTSRARRAAFAIAPSARWLVRETRAS